MVEFLEVDLQAIFEEVVEAGRAQGAASQEAYDDLVDEVVENHREWGEMHDDDPTVEIREGLKDRWPEYQEALGLGEEQPQL